MIFNTVNTKKAQLENGYFKTGNGPEVILIIGSCRSVQYVNYLHEWNEANKDIYDGERFTICFIDPFNFNYDLQDNRISMEEKIKSLETDESMLSLLRSTKYFIHEYFANYGMFNVSKDAEKNIYQFGMNPATMMCPVGGGLKEARVMDICIPSWNDKFVLFGDIVSFDIPIRKKAIQDYNVHGKPTQQTSDELYEISQKALNKFYEVCDKSDIPEMGEWFKQNWLSKRLFWTSNHVSREFSLAIFDFINNKYLGLDLSKGFDRNHEDMFANNYTKLTTADVERYHYFWGEQIIELREKLF